jgi:response regulator RpfG family c-di-GMP phosphodiesterase
MLEGADDYLTKPFSSIQLQARVRAALRLKHAQERSDTLNRHLIDANRDLELGLADRARDIAAAQGALAAALAGLVALRPPETAGHLRRVQRYCRRLAEAAAQSPAFAGQVDTAFIGRLECCAPLHDLGILALPEFLLMKPGSLTPDERLLIQTHTTLGADLVRAVAQAHDFAKDFLQMTTDVVRHHHERYDGRGYPDRLAGAAIPLAAQVVRIADVYDALRSRRVYKPPLPHAVAVQVMTEQSPGQFDPALLDLFRDCAADFELIFRDTPD